MNSHFSDATNAITSDGVPIYYDNYYGHTLYYGAGYKNITTAEIDDIVNQQLGINYAGGICGICSNSSGDVYMFGLSYHNYQSYDSSLSYYYGPKYARTVVTAIKVGADGSMDAIDCFYVYEKDDDWTDREELNKYDSEMEAGTLYSISSTFNCTDEYVYFLDDLNVCLETSAECEYLLFYNISQKKLSKIKKNGIIAGASISNMVKDSGYYYLCAYKSGASCTYRTTDFVSYSKVCDGGYEYFVKGDKILIAYVPKGTSYATTYGGKLITGI